MTVSDWRKTFKQLKAKPAKLRKYIKHNAPKKRSVGVTTTRCARCGRYRSHISKYGIDLCRQCFREVATKIGFKKFS
ncbi:MAG TPA: 30S ribosomal protein S14 [Candidatus Woesearchaeota archaeon]|nr:MAG: 30S ribosomal protein S14 [Candidatus Woesearchaeota archaeon]HDD70827.1 30S ribosomal protein S14 [Candidatus Woesearchaeota archaeon]